MYDSFWQPRTEECRPSDSVGGKKFTSNEADMQAGRGGGTVKEAGTEVVRGNGEIINIIVWTSLL